MLNRHLSDQQRRRVARLHEHTIEHTEGLAIGTVLSCYGNRLELETDAGETLECQIKKSLGALVVGDRVHWLCDKGVNVVLGVEKRQNLLSRPDRYKQSKAIAANIDQMIVVLSVDPLPIRFFLDKYLVIAALYAIPVAIAVNKMDTLTGDHAEIAQLIRDYTALGYPVWPVSAKAGQGLLPLQEALRDKTSILVGQSGVGKSELINALCEEAQAKTQAVSSANRQKGRHTTTASRLYHLPGGGQIIDSPGIRELGLWHIDTNQALQGFPEFKPLLGQCRFRNCAHQHEKDCALLHAVQTGQLLASRVESYQRIVAEIAES